MAIFTTMVCQLCDDGIGACSCENKRGYQGVVEFPQDPDLLCARLARAIRARRTLTPEERAIVDAAFWASVEVVHPGRTSPLSAHDIDVPDEGR